MCFHSTINLSAYGLIYFHFNLQKHSLIQPVHCRAKPVCAPQPTPLNTPLNNIDIAELFRIHSSHSDDGIIYNVRGVLPWSLQIAVVIGPSVIQAIAVLPRGTALHALIPRLGPNFYRGRVKTLAAVELVGYSVYTSHLPVELTALLIRIVWRAGTCCLHVDQVLQGLWYNWLFASAASSTSARATTSARSGTAQRVCRVESWGKNGRLAVVVGVVTYLVLSVIVDTVAREVGSARVYARLEILLSVLLQICGTLDGGLVF